MQRTEKVQMPVINRMFLKFFLPGLHMHIRCYFLAAIVGTLRFVK